MKSIDVAILDNGVNQLYIKSKLHFEVDVYDNKINTHKDRKSKKVDFNHGSICAQILEKYCLKARISSIKILNNAGKGYISSLHRAFEWCVCRNIRIINLSLGTENCHDRAEIRSIINHYANKGLIIIAASANDEYCTYPASFANVIGVCSGDGFSINKSAQLLKGIDFTAPSNHEVNMGGVSFRLGKSNSYAAPYVTAMVGNLIYEKGTMTLNEIRDSLSSEGSYFIYSPDWIETAWITSNYKKSRAKYYFSEDNRRLQDCFDDIDTIVISNPEEAELYAGIGKHIVYIGLESIVRIDKKHHFWCKEMRIKQIMSAKERTAELDIPVIYCMFDNTADVVWCLCELKRLFVEDGYNAFVGYSSPESVLYDLEYLPQESIIQEKTADFIYWQTYYQQSDLVLTGDNEKVQEVPFVENPDLIIDFDYKVCGYTVRIESDRGMESEKQYPDLETDSIKKIYADIICCFEKENE